MDIPKLYKYRYFNESPVSRNGLPNGEKIPQWQQVLYDGLIFPASPETFNDPYDCDFVLSDDFLNSRTARKYWRTRLLNGAQLQKREGRITQYRQCRKNIKIHSLALFSNQK